MADKCIEAGSMMEFTGKRRWRASKDDSWATVVRGPACGRVVGTRTIDGSRVAVVKSDGKFYAATVPSVGVTGNAATDAGPKIAEGQVKK
jgi:hypothetical protein